MVDRIVNVHEHSEKFAQAFEQYQTDVTDNVNAPVFRSEAYGYGNRTFSNENGVTVKSDYGRGDYNHYRPSDATGEYIEEIVAECMDVYRSEPIVHNVIDLMSDFGSQGVRIVCADKAQEKFGNEYAEYMGLPEFCDKFFRTLYVAGTVAVKRIDGKVPLKIQKRWKSTIAARQNIGTKFGSVNPYITNPTSVPPGQDPPDMKVVMNDDEDEPKRATLPLKWIIHDPRSVMLVGGMLGNFIGKPIFGLRINQQLRQEIVRISQLAQTGVEYQQLLTSIPKYVFDAISTNAMYFPLDQSKIYAYYYKKDDWELWGKPLIEPILRDVKMYNKLKLADMSALDGAVSSVRLWTMGDLEHEVVPSKGALEKLRNVLSQNVAGGTMDFVWGPDLKFTESNTNLHQFLGPDKYDESRNSIYAGLGVPPGLSGATGSSQTNNYVGLKTLIERLKYGRSILVSFLNEQLKLVQKAMGFKRKFRVVFDQMILSDEAAEKALLIQLADRDIISYETLRFAFDMDNSDIEDIKVARETRSRGTKLPPKTSPFHVDKQHDLNKLFVQKGSLTPEQVGLSPNPKPEGSENPNEEAHRMNMEKLKVGEQIKAASKPKGDTMTGRPTNSKDTKQRKKRRVLPKGTSASYASLYLFAESAREKVEDIITPAYLAVAEKKTVRSLSTEETNSLELVKFNVLAGIEPYSEVTSEIVANLASTSGIDEDIYRERQNLVYNFVEKYGREPNIMEKRKIECEAFANIYAEN